MNTRAMDPAIGSASSRYYFLVWLALGAAGIFYVTIAALAPEALRGAEAGGLEAINHQVAALATTVTSLKSRLDTSDGKQQALASGFDGLKGDVGGIKGKLTELDQSMSTRLSALEGHPVLAPEAKATLGPNAAVATQAVASKAARAAAPKIEGVVMPDDGSVDTTASTDPAVAVAAPVAKPRPYAVDLAMSTSTDALRQIWQLFKDQHPELMAGLSPRFVTSGPNVRLLAGPFPNQAVATAQCAKMRKEGVTCSPAPMAGTPL